MDMYGKSGSIEMATKVFDIMSERYAASWTVIRELGVALFHEIESYTVAGSSIATYAAASHKQHPGEALEGPVLSEHDRSKIERRKRKDERQREAQYQIHLAEMGAVKEGMHIVCANHDSGSGDTIRDLKINSRVKVQIITRDGDNDPHSSMRHVELTATLKNINEAEQLIKDVITEVGVIIGKSGGTIKKLQIKVAACIHLISHHLPEGDACRERSIRITGNKKQVEYAEEMIKDVMNQLFEEALEALTEVLIDGAHFSPVMDITLTRSYIRPTGRGSGRGTFLSFSAQGPPSLIVVWMHTPTSHVFYFSPLVLGSLSWGS